MPEGELNWSPVPEATLNLDATLRSGQSFRWRQSTAGEWLGVVADVALRLRPARNGFWWQTSPGPDQWDVVHDYFALDVDLERLSRGWILNDPRIASSVRRFGGLRILRQPAEEVFFSFQCACCNTITKITRSIQSLERRAGEPVAELDGQTLYRFPSASSIAELSEADLRKDLWGYRAPRVLEVARLLADGGERWFDSLRRAPYAQAHAILAELPGIGAKIADCICLFGLRHDEAVPVDTHVRRVLTQLYRPDLASKSLTPSVYAELGDLVREKFGCYAGWAQQYLFSEDLRIVA